MPRTDVCTLLQHYLYATSPNAFRPSRVWQMISHVHTCKSVMVVSIKPHPAFQVGGMGVIGHIYKFGCCNRLHANSNTCVTAYVCIVVAPCQLTCIMCTSADTESVNVLAHLNSQCVIRQRRFIAQTSHEWRTSLRARKCKLGMWHAQTCIIRTS